MSFSADLQFGQKYEKIAIELLGEGNVIAPPENIKFVDWDFKHNNVAYEVKADRRGATTGNFAIEYCSYDRPSGIVTTRADFWILFMVKESGYDCYKIPIGTLRDLCSNTGRKSQTPNGIGKFYLLAISGLEAYKWKCL